MVPSSAGDNARIGRNWRWRKGSGSVNTKAKALAAEKGSLEYLVANESRKDNLPKGAKEGPGKPISGALWVEVLKQITCVFFPRKIGQMELRALPPSHLLRAPASRAGPCLVKARLRFTRSSHSFFWKDEPAPSKLYPQNSRPKSVVSREPTPCC